MDRREDSRLEMVETLFMRNASYFAREKDMSESKERDKVGEVAGVSVQTVRGKCRSKSAPM